MYERDRKKQRERVRESKRERETDGVSSRQDEKTHDETRIEKRASSRKSNAAEDILKSRFTAHTLHYIGTRRTWRRNAAALHCSKVHPKPSASVTTLGVTVPAPGIYYSACATPRRPERLPR